jgi:hypothetical protein
MTIAEVHTENRTVHLSHGGHEFWTGFGRIDAAYRALGRKLGGDGAAMERAERRLMACLRVAVPGNRPCTHELALAMGLWLFRMEVYRPRFLGHQVEAYAASAAG